MKRMQWILALLVAGLLLPAPGQARDFRAPRLFQVPALAGSDYTLPDAWAGVWEETDSVFVGCSTGMFQETSTDTDTLCAGTSLEPDTTGVGTYVCEGIVTDTSVNMTCTGSYTSEGCTFTYTVHYTGTRSGNTSVVETNVLFEANPPSACFDIPPQCTRIVTRSTRIGPAPASCGTPVEETTWGAIKALHR